MGGQNGVNFLVSLEVVVGGATFHGFGEDHVAVEIIYDEDI